jgi:hypothetical protein
MPTLSAARTAIVTPTLVDVGVQPDRPLGLWAIPGSGAPTGPVLHVGKLGLRVVAPGVGPSGRNTLKVEPSPRVLSTSRRPDIN